MRMLLRVSIPMEPGNAHIKTGTLGSTMDRILADLKPQATYFFANDDGNRPASIVFDMKADPRSRRTLIPGIQCQGILPARDGSAGPRRRRTRPRTSRKTIRG